jgi:hypothetical protein
MSVVAAFLPRFAVPARPALILTALFALTAMVLAGIGPAVDAPPRWPADSGLYAVSGWAVSPASVDASRPGLTIVSHTYSRPDGARATLVVSTSPIAKAVYRAGAAVPFLGNGYTVETLPASGAREALIARRTGEAWAQVAVYGEQRGQYASGAVAWTLSTVDSILGRSNDYYLARIVTPTDNIEQAAQLADILFPRLEAFYAR